MTSVSDHHAPAQAEAAQRSWSARNPESARLFERAKEITAGGVHHNMRAVWPLPLFFERGEGAYKWDVDGHKYLDYGLGQGSLLLGHAHPKVVEAVTRAYMPGVPGGNHPLEVTWAGLINELIPSAQKVRFTMSGTEATLLALRLARAYTRRAAIVRFEGHYNGWHDYGMAGYRPPFERVASAGIPEEMPATVMVAPTGDGGARLEELLRTGTVAAVILEPSGASWGTVPLPRGFSRTVEALCRRYGTLLIFDEVITGFRFSPGGAQARDRVTPDLTSLGKIVSGGFPSGALVGRADIIDLMIPPGDGERPYVLHHGTFNGHPVAAAAGIATLSELSSGEGQKVADGHAAAIRAGVQQIIDELSIIGFTYGESSTFHVYLAARSKGEEEPLHGSRASPRSLTAHDFLSIPRRLIGQLGYELRSRGLDLFSYNGGMASTAHGDRELDQALSAFDGALRALRDNELVACR